MTTKFDEVRIIGRLEKLPRESKLIFALCCATRMLTSIEAYASRHDQAIMKCVRELVDHLWDSIELNSAVSLDLGAWTKLILDHIPPDQTYWAPFHVYADHGLSSLAYAVRCFLNPSGQEAAWSARRAYEAADQAAIRDLYAGAGTRGAEQDILEHPIVQRELCYQEEDLQTLEVHPFGVPKDLIRSIKQKAVLATTLTPSEIEK